jgi:hypothetical protein
MAVCKKCLRVFGNANKHCTCGSNEILLLTHEDGRKLTSLKGKNKKVKQQKLAQQIIKDYER